jgi:RNase P subunit RPR2
MNVEEFKKIIKTKINEDIELKDNNENARYIKRIDNIKDTERVEILNKIKKILAKKDFDDKKYIKNHVLI